MNETMYKEETILEELKIKNLQVKTEKENWP